MGSQGHIGCGQEFGSATTDPLRGKYHRILSQTLRSELPQAQSSHCSLGAVALLVSLDSLRSFAFGTPHWGDTSFAPPVGSRDYKVCGQEFESPSTDRLWREFRQSFSRPKQAIFRKLNRRRAPLERVLCLFRLTRSGRLPSALPTGETLHSLPRWAVAPIEGADRSSNLLQPTASDRNFIVGNPPASYHPFKKTCRDFIPGRQNDPMLFLAFYLSAVQAYRPALRVFGFAFLTGPGRPDGGHHSAVGKLDSLV